MTNRLLVAACVLGVGGCVQVRWLDRAEPLPTHDEPLEARVHENVVEPIALGRHGFVDAQPALTRAIVRATSAWSALHAPERPGGWLLLVELTQAQATQHATQVRVALTVRATLRARAGNVYLAQTNAHCVVSDRATPPSAAPLFARCMDNLGHELAGWLAGVTP